MPDTRAPQVPTWVEFCRTLLWLGLSAGSIALLIFYVSIPEVELRRFVGSNWLPQATRASILTALLASVGVTWATCLALVVWQRQPMVGRLSRLARLLCPCVLAFFVAVMWDASLWYGRPAVFLPLLALLVLALEQLLQQSGKAWAEFGWRLPGLPLPDSRLRSVLQRHAGSSLVIAAAAAYSVYVGHYCLVRHHALHTGAFDLGLFDNLMYNALHGDFFKSTIAVPDGSFLSNHAIIGMIFFIPLYAIAPGPESLLVWQAVLLGFAALPLYLFAATRIPRSLAVLLALSYLLYAPLHGANFYDFHWLPLTVFFYFWLFYAISENRPWLVGSMTLVLLTIREDVSVSLAMLGVLLLLSGQRPRLGAVLVGVAGIWFAIVKFVVMPMAGPWWFADIYKDLIPPGEEGYGSIVNTMLTNPSYLLSTMMVEKKLLYLLHLLAPLAFVPLRRVGLWLVLLPGSLFTLMTTGYDPTLEISFQYTAHWIPWLFGAAVLVLEQLGRSESGDVRRMAAAGAIAMGVLCHGYVYGAVLQRETFITGFDPVHFAPSVQEQQDDEDLHALLHHIPDDASVAATETVVPHVSTRAQIFTLRITHGDADYVLVHRREMHDIQKDTRQAIKSRGYDLVESRGNLFLFRQAGAPPESPRPAPLFEDR